MAQAQGQNVDTLLAGQLVNALSTMSIQERRRCEYHACVNFKEVQKEGEKVLVCSSCKSVGVLTVYCTVECQKGHWTEHKTVCVKQTTTTTTTTVTSATPSSVDHAPPPLGEHVSQPMGFTANDLLKLLDKFKSAGSIPAARSSPGDEEDDDEEGDDEEDEEGDEDDEDDDEEEEEEEEINQDVDSFGRPLPQNRKKRRPAFSFGGNADDSEEEEATKKEEEKVEPFLPFGPIQEGTRYWDFGAQPGGAAAGAPGPSPTKPAGRKRVQGRRGPAPSGEKEPENKEALSALSFDLGNPGTPPATSGDSASTTSAAPVFSFGATSSSDDSVPTFTLGNSATVPTPSVPTTFQFGN